MVDENLVPTSVCHAGRSASGRGMMTTPAGNHDGVTVREITRQESWAMLDADCRRWLGISAEEFAARYHAGEYDDPDEDTRIMRLAMHLEFLQQTAPSK
jgi:hypothetical protein